MTAPHKPAATDTPAAREAITAGLRCPRCGTVIAQADAPGQLRCSCGGPLMQQYDLELLSPTVRDTWSRRPFNVWRYRELLPMDDVTRAVSLAEGGTPLLQIPATADRLGLNGLVVKDEGRNPTGTFKARGASVGVSRLAELGVKALAMPSVGSGGSAWSAYGARAGVAVHVGLPSGAGIPVIGSDEATLYGADVTQFPGDIRGAFAAFRKCADQARIPLVGAFQEPYRLEGEKTIGLEIAEQFDWRPPHWIAWPTGGAVGLVGLAKSFGELQRLGWLEGDLPGLIAVQIEGCSTLVDAISRGSVDPVSSVNRTESIAPGITVPDQPFADVVLGMCSGFKVLGVTVSEEDIMTQLKAVGRGDGLMLSPEGAAAVAAVGSLRAGGAIAPDASVVVVNTATGLRYPHLVADTQPAPAVRP